MTHRTIDALIGAANGAADLQAMAHAFLIQYRKHANGVNGVDVPNENFSVVTVGIVTPGNPDDPLIAFELAWTSHWSVEVPTYYDVDDDNFHEGYGSENNISGYTVERGESNNDKRLNIPARLLLLGEDKQVAYLKNLKSKDDAAKQERQRAARMAELKKEMDALTDIDPDCASSFYKHQRAILDEAPPASSALRLLWMRRG